MDDGDKYTVILQHRIRWHLGDDGPSELPEPGEEQFTLLIKEGFNQGELLASSEGGESDRRGWWSIA